MKVLVTGGAGFIGARVAAQLAADGHEVRVLDALLPEAHGGGDAGPPLPSGVEVLVGDVRDPAIVAQALSGVHAVCHQAAMVGLGLDLDDAPKYVACNDLGTAVLLAAMARAGVRSLVLAGSMVVYGEGRYRCTVHGEAPAAPRRVADLEAGRFEPRCRECGRPLQPELVQETAALDPRNVYAATKVAQEHLAAVWARACDGRAISLRYHNVYGPGMPRDTPYAGVASLFRSALARGEAPRVYEDGGQRRDFVHVNDVAAANRAALERVAGGSGGTGEAFRAYNVGSGEVRTVGEMARALATACGGPEPVVTGQYRLGDVRHVTASSQRLRSELGWRPQVPFHVGMAEFAAAPQRAAAAGPGLRGTG
ncbi:NAD-dependent epimerase/dehydratase family protein [Streptacidiphilus griseoplanus]|uniref:NAD-dependent epimerase/dehydratase family protein n=1 Tax=Peterkaempfera griseoplana TaxID=66896 RepID=UPI0006E31CC7|nr:NAD-dependent epimerase/dehydratase family protein [Peterkaempfera griseoplana]